MSAAAVAAAVAARGEVIRAPAGVAWRLPGPAAAGWSREAPAEGIRWAGPASMAPGPPGGGQRAAAAAARFFSTSWALMAPGTRVLSVKMTVGVPVILYLRPKARLRCTAEVSHWAAAGTLSRSRSEEHTSELQSPCNLVCRLLLEKKKNIT